MAARSWNRVELIGNLTRDPEVRITPSGATVCTFSIATNRSYVAGDGERKEEVDFHRIVAWNKVAELCGQLLKKGTRVFVSGRLQNRNWEGPDGQNRQVTEVVISDMIVLTPRNGVSEGGYVSEEEVEAVPPTIEQVPAKDTPSSQPEEEEVKATAQTEKESQPKEVKEERVNDKDLPF